MNRRVVITGWGAVTPLGRRPDALRQGLEHGVSGVRTATRFSTEQLPIKIAAEVRDEDLADIDTASLSTQSGFALAAAEDAAAMAGLEDAVSDPRRLGIYLGCGELFQDFRQFAALIAAGLEGPDAAFQLDGFIRRAMQSEAADEELRLDPSSTGTLLAGRFNAQGPHANCTSACASSSQAIGEAGEMIRRGEADLMLTGGAHSMIHPFGIIGFHRLGTLSPNLDGLRAMRPFDRDRNGFVVGEGAALLVLEELDHARRRGADIWAELTGYGAAQDAYRITDIHPDGRGAVSCIRRALDDARVNPDQIDYINAHGTSTVLNDKTETAAIKRVFGPAAYSTWVSSSKSMMGHATTAGGALELAVCLLAMRHELVPPTVNYDTPDPDCDLDYVPNIARRRHCRHVLSNSFGFGGQNVALLLSQFAA